MKDSIRLQFTAFLKLATLWLLVTCATYTTPAQYRFTQWTPDSGLPQSSVRGLVQTPDGFLWIATLNGIAKFDGVHFQIFDKSNTPGITSNRFVGMSRGPGEDLWFTSEDGNVMLRRGTKFRTMGEQDGMRPRSVEAITGTPQGQVWVESDGKVLHWNETSQRFKPESFNTETRKFHALAWVGSGFWTIEGNRVVIFNRGNLATFAAPTSADLPSVMGVAANANGDAWISTKDGRMGRLSDKPPVFRKTPDYFVLHGAPGTDWNLEISPYRFERTLLLPVEGAIHPIRLQVIGTDNEGNAWVGAEGEGLFRIQRQFIMTLGRPQGLVSDNTYPIFHSRTGDMWAGSWPGGLSQIRNGKVIRTLGLADGLPALVSSITEDKDGVLWVGTHGGVRTLVNGHLKKPALPFDDSSTAAQVILQTADGAMFFGTPRGLYIVRDGTAQHLSMAEGLATDDVRVVLMDRHHDVWMGGYGGVTRVHNGQMSRWTEAQGLPSNNVRSLVEDSNGEIWVGTYDGGMGWFRNGRWVTFNTKNGLYDSGVFQILEDSHHWFWISSNRGIYRVSREQLAAVADGKQPLVASIAYGRSDGMASAECNGGLWPAGSADGEGKLWFPTQMGIAIVDPAKVHVVTTPPSVAIETASVENKPESEPQSVVLSPGQTNLEVSYTALGYTKPEQMTFRYKMDGVDGDWQQVGLRRTAYYTHLPPGNYIFRVSATNSDGIRSRQDAVLHVQVIPPFYRRWWFITGAVILLVLLVSAAWLFRVRQLQQAQERQQNFSRQLIASQEGERRRIAGELHDSLGQRLIIINNLAQFLLRSKGKVRTEEEKRQTVEEISGEASAAIDETRAISYALRPFQLDRLGLTRAIQALCTTIMKASEITIQTELADIDDAFPEDLRINVYRIVQEALNNIVKHSEASMAKVTAFRMEDAVTLIIKDDGRGIAAKPRTYLPGGGGFGMTGMRERVTLLNGTLQVDSNAATGTLVRIELPIAKSRVL
ncbi:sensor histidine kinase [Terriglobus sp. TAA 43]|uniref:sensor histidine kinase n=1 Tax=Terriglobus sp. TAA 43 TaxID=278961 RepID=UPI0018DD957E|nr:sensor histidine kinase [Terriglobus sp. TAA 43]